MTVSGVVAMRTRYWDESGGQGAVLAAAVWGMTGFGRWDQCRVLSVVTPCQRTAPQLSQVCARSATALRFDCHCWWRQSVTCDVLAHRETT